MFSSYAQALNRASIRKSIIKPKKPNPMAGKRKLWFVFGNDPIDLSTIPGNDPVWLLCSFRKLLEDHGSTEIEVFKKAGKRGIISAQVVGGPKLRRAYQRPVSVTIDEYLDAYYWVNDYLAEQGVTFTSSSWASEQIFRMGFSKPLVVSNPLGRVLMKASRGICRPDATYRGLIEQWDIKSAYPHAMLDNAHRFPTRLIPIEPDEWATRDSSIVLAHVWARNFPEHQIPIIQEHPTDIDSPREKVAWLFDFEVETLLEHNHHVEIYAAFKIQTADLSDELGRWHDILQPRYINEIGYAGKILKSIANALWGSFASSTVNAYTWEFNEHGIPQTKTFKRKAYGGQIGAEHIAAWVNASVSDRVFREFIEPHNVLYFDTDGGFCRPLADRMGEGDFGGWRFEGYYRKLEVIGWQAYAAWHDDGIDVVLSGVPDATYTDLKRYGASDERHDYMSRLIEDNPFSQITAVGQTRDIVSTIPSSVAELSPKHWHMIEHEIAPHASMVKAVGQDQVSVSAPQAEAFRHLANFSKKTLDSDESMTTVEGAPSNQDKERMVHDGGKQEQAQGQLWG